MTSRLNPYLTFDGNAREAMEFYRSVFGGELTVNTFGEFGAPDPAVADRVMHAQLLTSHGYALMASDTAPGMPMAFTPGTNITCSLSGDADDGLAEIWAKLVVGGSVTMPLEKQVWGDEFGQCVDRYGIPWMVNIAQPAA
jgi:PhnB protein